MKKSNYSLFILLFGFFWLSCKNNTEKNDANYISLKEEFMEPQGTARPKVYWWWLNGDVDTISMKEELKAIKHAGIGAVNIFEIGVPVYANPQQMVPAGPPYMGEESLQIIATAIREATKLDLEVDLNLSSSWNAGGSWITPRYSAKSLYHSKTAINGAGPGQFEIPFPEIPIKDNRGNPNLIQLDVEGKPVYREEIALLALPKSSDSPLDTAQIINLSHLFDPEKDILEWDVPEGTWEIHRFVCSNSGEKLKLPSPNSMGPIIDHFDSAATEFHFRYFIDRLEGILGTISDTGLKSLYLASFEATGTVWTGSLVDEFLKNHRYPLHKFLLYFFEPDRMDPTITQKFKNDFSFTISELMINNHYRKGSEIARNHGLQLICESGGPGPPLHNVPVESIKALGALDVPRGEFWINHKRMADSIDLLMVVKGVAAASNIYQRKITEMEAFTSFQHWQEGPGDMKPIGDRAFGEGMNRVVVHGFTHNPGHVGFPGIVYHAGTHYNNKRVWWPKVRPFNDYLARISFLFQETDFFADVAYYYGDKVPNFASPKNTKFAVGSGYDYEIINTEILLNDLDVKDGRLTLSSGAQFSVLALGEITGNIPGVWEKVHQLAQKGAIITGLKPEHVLAEWEELWLKPQKKLEKEDLTKGKLLPGIPSVKILEALDILPDFDYAEKMSDNLDYQQEELPVLEYSHYKKGNLDFYFIRNTGSDWVSRSVIFRQDGKSPELWHPVTGEIVSVSIFKNNKGMTEIPLTLAPYESYFIVFSPEVEKARYSAITSKKMHPPFLEYGQNGLRLLEEGDFELKGNKGTVKLASRIRSETLTGPWRVDFNESWGAPATAEFPSLISWTESRDSGIKYYSGMASYHKKFQFNKEESAASSKRIFLDLGTIEEVGEVWLNGVALGITWSLPHRFEVGGTIRDGENDLKIEIANTWSNRIVGDHHLGENYTSTNVQTARQGVPWAEAQLLESGLLGPVTLQISSTEEIDQ